MFGNVVTLHKLNIRSFRCEIRCSKWKFLLLSTVDKWMEQICLKVGVVYGRMGEVCSLNLAPNNVLIRAWKMVRLESMHKYLLHVPKNEIIKKFIIQVQVYYSL